MMKLFLIQTKIIGQEENQLLTQWSIIFHSKKNFSDTNDLIQLL